MKFRVTPDVLGPLRLAGAMAFFALLARPVSPLASDGLAVVAAGLTIACVIVLFEEMPQ